jgi:hypothetical protein
MPNGVLTLPKMGLKNHIVALIPMRVTFRALQHCLKTTVFGMVSN